MKPPDLKRVDSAVFDRAALRRFVKFMQSYVKTSLPRLLIVDDDQPLVQMLREYLGHEGFSVESSSDAVALRDKLAELRSDALILDIMLPGKNGLELLQEIRVLHPLLPVLMLTARGSADDRIRGFELGADDYLPKPFDPRELVARLRALLRRSHAPLLFEGLELDPSRRQVRWQGQPLDLTAAEFRILQQLLTTPSAPVSREVLSAHALGRALQPHDRAIDTHVSNLRRKLAVAGIQHLALRSVRGTGYEIFALSTS